MRTVFAVFLVAHGLLHLLGFAKAFGLAALPQLTQPISPLFGVVWLISAVLFLCTAVALFVWPRGWWALGICAVLVSTVAIVPSWADAKVGALANAIVLAGVVFGFLSRGPFSLRAEYERDVASRLSAEAPLARITDADLAHLPLPVQRYARAAGVVGQPHVRNFRARIHGRIRGGRGQSWMPIAAEQYNHIDPPARLFYLTGSMFALPVQGYHRYVASAATMRIKAAALVPVVSSAGLEMTQSETVTLLNDLCILAPAALVDEPIAWEAVDAHTVRARFTNAGHTVRAELTFNDAGELTNFVSDDRYQLSTDGKSMSRVRWSTPVSEYRSFNGVRLSSRGAGRWHDREGEYDYIQLTIDDVEYNVTARDSSSRR